MKMNQNILIYFILIVIAVMSFNIYQLKIKQKEVVFVNIKMVKADLIAKAISSKTSEEKLRNIGKNFRYDLFNKMDQIANEDNLIIIPTQEAVLGVRNFSEYVYKKLENDYEF